MRVEYDFSKAERAAQAPHSAKPQAEATGKSRRMNLLNEDVLMVFRARAEAKKTGDQTLIHPATKRL